MTYNVFSGTLNPTHFTASELMSIDEAYLSTWFVYEYIEECARLCPDYVLRLFDDASSSFKLQNAVSAIVDFRLSISLHDLWYAVYFGESYLSGFISNRGLTLRSCVCLMNELTKCDGGFSLQERISAVALLHVARNISRNGFNNDLVHVLAAILGLFNDTARYSMQRGRVFSLNADAKLMKVAVNNPRSTVQLIEIELSKAYLHRALTWKDSDSDSIYCLANVYLAVLYYTSGQFQTAIDHCTLVMRSQDHSQCRARVVQGEILRKTDDDIDSVLGLAVFYQYVLSATLMSQQQQQQ